MIKILIVDDHPIIRSGLKQIIADEYDMKVVFEAENANVMFDFIEKESVDIIILDISMPGMSGIEAMEILSRSYKNIPVLVLSGMPEKQYGLRILKIGASGYLHKESAPDELVKAIRIIVNGGHYLSSGLSGQLIDNIGKKDVRNIHQRLSNREFEIMCRIASGKTVGEIADEILLSVKTVSTYRSRILEKMDMKNNAELTHYCIKNGLVE
jgi:DNA-binding NarL/FixJ family response regulator